MQNQFDYMIQVVNAESAAETLMSKKIAKT